MEVVCALIIQNKKVLLTQRPLHKSKAGLWEFPGGQVETFETERQALARELKEELNIQVTETEFSKIGDITGDNIHLHFYSFELKTPYIPFEHCSTSWCTFKDLTQFSLCPLDQRGVDSFFESIQTLCPTED